MIDAHCHLYDVADLDASLREFRRLGGTAIASFCEDLESLKRNCEVAELHSALVLPGGGMHPAHINRFSDEDIDQFFTELETLAPRLKLVGEAGLDYKHADTPEAKLRQKQLLDRHFEFAARHRLPLSLHSRRSERAVLEAAMAFHETHGVNVALHWFTHSRKLIKLAVEGGLFISAGPIILQDEHSLQAALTIPLESLLTETDAPVPFKEGDGRPSAAHLVLKKLAKEHNLLYAELEAQVERNFRRLMQN